MASLQRPFRIGIVGSYGGLNLGDEAILQTIVAQLKRSLLVEITVFSRQPADTLRRHAIDRAVAVRHLSRAEVIPEVERLDLLILGGGGILFDSEARTFLREVLIAEERDIPVMVYAISAGPLDGREPRETVCRALNNAALVTVRERRARALLEELGVRAEIRVTADPAVLLQPEPVAMQTLKRQGIDGQLMVGMSVREPGGAAPDITQASYSVMANAADFMVDRFDADILFIPLESGDLQHSHAVIAQMLRAPRASVLKGEFTPGQMITLLQHMEFAVGMRLHFLIFAALAGVPFVALPYAEKVRGFLDTLGLESPPLHQVNSGRLIAHIDHSWDRRRSLVGRIQRALPAMQDSAAETHKALIALINERTPKQI